MTSDIGCFKMILTVRTTYEALFVTHNILKSEYQEFKVLSINKKTKIIQISVKSSKMFKTLKNLYRLK